MNELSISFPYAIPVLILVIPSAALKKVKAHEVFCESVWLSYRGSHHSFLVVMSPSVSSVLGAMDILVKFFSPLTRLFGMPGELLPLALMKSLSGSGANGLLTDALKTYGPDSLIGRMASIMAGSSETTFYVIAVYFGAVGVRKTRHAVPAGLIADVAGILAAVWIAHLMFS